MASKKNIRLNDHNIYRLLYIVGSNQKFGILFGSSNNRLNKITKNIKMGEQKVSLVNDQKQMQKFLIKKDTMNFIFQVMVYLQKQV